MGERFFFVSETEDEAARDVKALYNLQHVKYARRDAEFYPRVKGENGRHGDLRLALRGGNERHRERMNAVENAVIDLGCPRWKEGAQQNRRRRIERKKKTLRFGFRVCIFASRVLS